MIMVYPCWQLGTTYLCEDVNVGRPTCNNKIMHKTKLLICPLIIHYVFPWDLFLVSFERDNSVENVDYNSLFSYSHQNVTAATIYFIDATQQIQYSFVSSFSISTEP